MHFQGNFMTIQRDANIFTLEPGFDTLTISSGQSTSGWFDLKGMTLFGISYPLATEGYQIGFDIKTESGVAETWMTNSGGMRSVIINTTSLTSSTLGFASVEPSLTGGIRYFRIYTATSVPALQTQSADRTFYVKARYII